jgi:hypothetical protein
MMFMVKRITNERNSIRPTLDVNGIWEDIPEGAKPYCEFSFRQNLNALGSKSDWEEITELFTKHFMSIAPAGVTKSKTTSWRTGICYAD